MHRRGRPPHPDILTPREWEVLSLIREGAPNEEIAQRLGITQRTAKYHVSEILSKLGVSSREEAAMALDDRASLPVSNRRSWSAAWAWLARFAAVGASAAVLAGVGFLAWGVLQSSGDDELSADMSVDAVFARVAAAATRPGTVLHVSYAVTNSGTNETSRTVEDEYWVDPETEAARIGSGQYGLDVVTKDGRYSTSGDRTVPDSNWASQTTWCPEPQVLLQSLIACTFGGEVSGSPVVKDEDWQGKPAIALVGIFDVVSDIPAESSHYRMTMTTYLDPETALPVAVRTEDVSLETDWRSTVVSTYRQDFVDRSSLPDDFFDPASLVGTGD